MNVEQADKIVFAAECATIAYQLDKPIPAELGLDRVQILYDDHTPRGFFANCKYGTVVAIKGTADLKDAETDANVSKSIFLGRYRVHSGFFNEHQHVFGQVMEGADLSLPILFTGHSLGAAIATLLAMSAKTEYSADVEVINFGSPRVGDKAFAKAYNKIIPKTVRVVHDKDVVPRVPKLFYHHVDRLHRITADGKILRATTNWLKELFWFGKIVLSDLDGEALDDHRMGNYLAAIKKMHARVLKRRK